MQASTQHYNSFPLQVTSNQKLTPSTLPHRQHVHYLKLALVELTWLAKPKKVVRYSQESMQSALDEIKKGMSIHAAAKMFNIPNSTLHDHVSGKSSKVGAGAPTVLSYCEEQEIILTCQVLAEMGFGITRELVTVVLSDFIRERHC